jgi:hypothetical protein
MEALQLLLSRAPPAVADAAQGPPGEQQGHAAPYIVRGEWLGEAVSGLENNTNSLVQAALGGHSDILRVLVDTGRWLSKSAEMSKALVAASWKGHLEAMQLLLQHKADVNAGATVFTRDGPLGMAIAGGQLRAAELLILEGAEMGGAALEHAARSNYSIPACKLVLKYFIDLKNQGMYAAASAGKKKTVEFLMQADARMLRLSHDAMTDRVTSALSGAASGGHLELTQSLLATLKLRVNKGVICAAELQGFISTALAAAQEGQKQQYGNHHYVIRWLEQQKQLR